MKRKILGMLTGGLLCLSLSATGLEENVVDNYQNNRYPLVRKPLIALPLGSIKPQGWLEEMLIRQKNGLTGHLDEVYPQVVGKRNGWLGGDGDQWERGPYWIDGLLPLAYLLDDEQLKAKVQPWIEWTLQSQREDGFFGPATDYPNEEGLQREQAQDWWPRMVMLKILQQYYSATNDQRVIKLMSDYFRYQLKTLPEKRLGYWTFWADFRACDNLQAVYWLYNITGEKFLLELSELIHRQGVNYVDMINRGDLRRINTIHCVNLAQGIKEPIIYYQQNADKEYIYAVKRGLQDIRQYHGQPQGMYGGDEAMHGNNPTQGSELCSAMELMYSLEKMTEITGDIEFADHLEKIAFNALPTQISDDFMSRQYYQQPNQVMISRHDRNFDREYEGTENVFGTLSGFPCCLANMHQGWPKFVQNLWYATPDQGIAAFVYSPSEVTAKVGDNCNVTINEETCYPMDDKIRFTIKEIGNKKKQLEFPLHLRIPQWCRQAEIHVNGEVVRQVNGGEIAVVHRIWNRNDCIELYLPMEIKASTWYENSVTIERGPLVYALKMEEKWKKMSLGNNSKYGPDYYQVTSDEPWNYGLVDFNRNDVKDAAKVIVHTQKQQSLYPWNVENAPIEIKMKARLIPNWQLYNEMAGPQPFSFCNSAEGEIKEITLIPYGCTTLRISEFPIVGR